MEYILSKVIGSGLESSDCYKETLNKDVFLGIFKNFLKSGFCDYPLKKMHEVIFYNSV